MLAATAFILLSLSAAAGPAAEETVEVRLGAPLSGADFLLIAETLRHRAMRGADIACYNIHVFDRQGARTVAFIEARQRVIEEDGREERILTFLPPDPNCRSISFEMDRRGRVSRVIYSRH